MKKSIATQESPLRLYTRLLLRLHELIAAGKGDEAEADVVRDEMDMPWHSLTEAEQELAGGLSEDLYALAENKPRSLPMSAEERRNWGLDFRAVFEARHYHRALALLRQAPADVSGDQVCFLQADCWEHLGCPEIALRFLHASTRFDAAQVVSGLMFSLPQDASNTVPG